MKEFLYQLICSKDSTKYYYVPASSFTSLALFGLSIDYVKDYVNLTVSVYIFTLSLYFAPN